MMKNHIVETFSRKFKIKNQSSTRTIGLECEFPLVHCSGNAVDYDVVRGMFSYLKIQDFELCRDTLTHEVMYAVKASKADGENADYGKNVIGTDTGYCTLEVALKPERNLFAVAQQLNEVMRLLIDYFREHNCLILGYGIQPVTPPGQRLVSNFSRYLLTSKYSINRFIDQRDGVDFHLFTITASNQCHINVFEEEAIKIVNVLNGLSGLQIALTANSPVWKNQIDQQWKATREIFWDYGFTERQNQIGIPKKFDRIDDYVEYLCDFKPCLIERNGQSVYILNKNSLKDFFDSNEPVLGHLISGEKIAISPRVDDIIHHAGFAWFNARLAPKYGTVESRVSCQQPPNETMVVTALVLGVIENIKAAEEILNQYSWKEWTKLRFDSIRHGLQAELSGTSVLPLVEELVKIAEIGLRKRGLGEEKFLEPAFKRIADKKVPADNAIDIFLTGNLTNFLDLFAFH